MVESEADLMTLLRQLDDPEWLEWPRGYNRREAAVLLARLVSRLEGDFATLCPAERDTQDSSEYGRVVVPAEVTVCGTRIVVCVSKFGSLALVSADNPGAFLGTEDAQAEGELDAGDLAKVEQALIGLGYVVVPEELLMSRYDGMSPLRSHGQWQPSWWDRFFGTF
ncbi:hypothetical protein OG735_22220 [Streptomyces sp. NBC_01210]|uniref:hypothetical protein n=1 Tax=Streptomyces sp. NBC_01210 TaxID=2903774 RepID=UPI002E0EE05B|nr:hypothetical protein OG735_22220 [Streptomyces sp. NBC_01210]